MESTALNLDAWNPLLNWYQLHNSAGNPLHSIGIHCHMLHGFHCMQPGYIAPRCMQSTAFTLDVFHNAACNPLHSLWMYFTTLHGIQCIQSFRMQFSASIKTNWAMLHGIHCIQSGSIGPCCMESTAFNRDPLGQAAWNPLHSIGISYIKLHGIHFIQSRYIAPL